MNTETKKIALACFIGGVTCSVVMLLVAPRLWWFGLLAGFAAGYLSYEFREVLKTVPGAWAKAQKANSDSWSEATLWLRKWRSRPHPFTYAALAITVPIFVWALYTIGVPIRGKSGIISTLVALLFNAVFLPLMFVVIVMVAEIIITFLAFIGARVGERCYWWPFIMFGAFKVVRGDLRRLDGEGLKRLPLTNKNVARWFVKGLGLTVLFFIFTMWKYQLIVAVKIIGFVFKFLCYLVRQIHSDKRLLCGVDGAIGGGVSYLWLLTPEATLAGNIVVVLFGGLLGAALGVLNWELVSKRILHLAPTEV